MLISFIILKDDDKYESSLYDSLKNSLRSTLSSIKKRYKSEKMERSTGINTSFYKNYFQ